VNADTLIRGGQLFLLRGSLLLFSIVKIGLQQFSWTTDTWDIR